MLPDRERGHEDHDGDPAVSSNHEATLPWHCVPAGIAESSASGQSAVPAGTGRGFHFSSLIFLSKATKRGSERSGSKVRSSLSQPSHCESEA